MPDEWKALPEDEKNTKRARGYTRMRQCGSHYVVDTIAEVMPCKEGSVGCPSGAGLQSTGLPR